jgi:hypothetical protein
MTDTDVPKAFRIFQRVTLPSPGSLKGAVEIMRLLLIPVFDCAA